MTTKTEQATSASVRMLIDGQWTVCDMKSFFQTCNLIYLFHYWARIENYSTGDVGGLDDIARTATHFDPPQLLDVQRIRYGSPGLIDLRGLGEPIKQLKDFLWSPLDYLMKWKTHRQESIRRQIDNDEARRALDMARRMDRYSVLDRHLEACRKYNLSPVSLHRVMFDLENQLDVVEGLINDGKITGITDVPHDETT
jgi:hypothetical protein